MATKSVRAKPQPTAYKFVCVGPDGEAYLGTTPIEAYEKYKRESCYDIDGARFFEIGKEFIGREEVVLTEVKHGA